MIRAMNSHPSNTHSIATGKLVVNRNGHPYRSGTDREFDLMLAAREASGGVHYASSAFTTSPLTLVRR